MTNTYTTDTMDTVGVCLVVIAITTGHEYFYTLASLLFIFSFAMRLQNEQRIEKLIAKVREKRTP